MPEMSYVVLRGVGVGRRVCGVSGQGPSLSTAQHHFSGGGGVTGRDAGEIGQGYIASKVQAPWWK